MNSTTWIISPNWVAWTLLGVATASLVAIVVCSIVFIRRNNPSKNQDSTSPIGSPQNAQEIHRLKSSVTVLAVVVTIIFVWLCYACWCDLKFGSDSSAGALMTALGIMVTALIGWQVFNAIENVKTLKKMEALESDLVKAKSDFEQQDARNLDLIRAVNEIRKARAFKYEFTKYKSAAKAIKLLLSAKVPVEDDLIKVQKELLITILDGIEKEDDPAKATFADACPVIDDLYHDIIEAINARTEDLNAFKREITSIRDRRVAFANKYRSH